MAAACVADNCQVAVNNLSLAHSPLAVRAARTAAVLERLEGSTLCFVQPTHAKLADVVWGQLIALRALAVIVTAIR